MYSRSDADLEGRIRPARYRAAWLLPVASPPIADGALLVDESGRLAAVDAAAHVPLPEGAEDVDLGAVALLPGLVNAHTHPELSLFRGSLEDLSFVDWIRTLVARKRALPSLDYEPAAAWACAEALAAGITTLAATEDSGAGLDALLRAGMRGVVYREVFGPDPAQAEASMADLRRRVDMMRLRENALVRVGISPHAPYTVSDALYRNAADYARAEHLPIAVHVAESRAESELVRHGRGPFADGLAHRGIATRRRGRSSIALLQRLNVLGPSTLLIHCVRVNGEDVARIAATGAGIAHCPAANARLGHGVAPLERLLSAGIPVGLGTDSVASNNRQDLLEEARTAQLLHRATLRDPSFLPPSRLLELATLDGARALGLADRIGSLEVGKDADFCAVSLETAHAAPVHDPVAAVVLSARGADVALTAVRGRILYRGGGWLTLDIPEIRDRLERQADRLRALERGA